MILGDFDIYWDPEDFPLTIKLHPKLSLTWQAALRSAIILFNAEHKEHRFFKQSVCDSNELPWPEDGYLHVFEDSELIKPESPIHFDLKSGRINYACLALPLSKIIKPDYRIELIKRELDYILCSWAGK